VIALRNVYFDYPGGITALSDVSYTIMEGATVVVGPNGSGKTTLLKVAGLLYKPSRGSISVDSVEFWTQPSDVRVRIRRNIVYVHDNPVMVTGSVAENIAYGLILRGVGRSEALEEAYRFLADLKLEWLASRNSKNLSSGEAQLVSLIRALILKPKCLLLDEPTSNLDPDRRRIFVKLIEDYDGVLVVATNDYSLASRIADRIVVMKGGRIVSTDGVELLADM
jgi:energy-coupling factor transporter ATP-binding protein EcfA2